MYTYIYIYIYIYTYTHLGSEVDGLAGNTTSDEFLIFLRPPESLRCFLPELTLTFEVGNSPPTEGSPRISPPTNSCDAHPRCAKRS